jgi:antitoxin component HigA of HigAB toxin-antitoxin module
MGTMTKLLEDIKQDVLDDKKVNSPGPAYDSLCALFPLKAIGGKREHGLAVEVAAKVTEYLIASKGGSAELGKQVAAYLRALGVLIEKYEQEQFPMAGKNVSGVEMLRYLMEEHGAKQADLKKDLGGQSVVSLILEGERKLNTRQIAALAERFHVSPSVFFDS